jgi:RimJ/RimL family protein N-acetyltransferase
MGRILLFADEFVGSWLAERMGISLNPPYTSFGLVGPDGLLTGAMIFNGFNEGNAEVSIYAPKAVTRGSLRAAASYLFETAGCNRVTARTRASNLRVRRFIEKVGFQREGVLRAYYSDGEDAILYGLLKHENRW